MDGTLRKATHVHIHSLLSPEEIDSFPDFLLGEHDLFALRDDEIGLAKGVVHNTDTGSHPPVTARPAGVLHGIRARIEEAIQALLEQGVFRPSTNDWTSRLVPVLKKDGAIRFCVDYRQLNAITMKDLFPLLRTNDLLEGLGASRAKFFSKLDMKSGYHMIPLTPEASRKSAFVCHSGLFEYTRLPFGLSNAPRHISTVC